MRSGIRLFVLVLGLCLLASAQRLDFALGVGGVAGHNGGGAWPSLSISDMFKPHVGVSGEFALRAQRLNQTQRVSFTSASLVLRGRDQWSLEFQAGWALEHVTRPSGCLALPGPFGPPCAPFPSTTRNGAHFELAKQFYLSPRAFVRFEYHQYIFGGSDQPARFAVSVGYTFGGH